MLFELEQIYNDIQSYEQNLKERGFKNITKMVYAFKGKEVKMEIY